MNAVDVLQHLRPDVKLPVTLLAGELEVGLLGDIACNGILTSQWRPAGLVTASMRAVVDPSRGSISAPTRHGAGRKSVDGHEAVPPADVDTRQEVSKLVWRG